MDSLLADAVASYHGVPDRRPGPENRRAGLTLLGMDTSPEGLQVHRRPRRIGIKSIGNLENSFIDASARPCAPYGLCGRYIGRLSNHIEVRING
ncbi:hypothetical protein RHDE110596_17240 [Prescottella defluvii]